MGKAQRTKGHQFEREMVRLLKKYGFDAKRMLEYQEGLGFDIVAGDFIIQCKCMKSQPNLPQVFKEFKGDETNDIKVVIFKVTNKGTYAAFKIDDALLMMDAFNRQV